MTAVMYAAWSHHGHVGLLVILVKGIPSSSKLARQERLLLLVVEGLVSTPCVAPCFMQATLSACSCSWCPSAGSSNPAVGRVIQLCCRPGHPAMLSAAGL